MPEPPKQKMKSQEKFDRGKDAFEDGTDLQDYRTYGVAVSLNWCLSPARYKNTEAGKADAGPVLMKFILWWEKRSCCT